MSRGINVCYFIILDIFAGIKISGFVNWPEPIVVGRPLKGNWQTVQTQDQMPQNGVSDQGLHCLQIV